MHCARQTRLLRACLRGFWFAGRIWTFTSPFSLPSHLHQKQKHFKTKVCLAWPPTPWPYCPTDIQPTLQPILLCQRDLPISHNLPIHMQSTLPAVPEAWYFTLALASIDLKHLVRPQEWHSICECEITKAVLRSNIIRMKTTWRRVRGGHRSTWKAWWAAE